MVTFCVVTRIFRGEIPYINNFIDYYINFLGVKRIYIFSFDNTPWSKFISKDFNNLYKVFYIDYRESWVKSYEKVSGNIREDYIINADCDEYLYVRKDNLQKFIKKHSQYSEIRLPWLFACANDFGTKNINEILDKSQYKAFVKNYKTILKRRDIISPWHSNRNPHAALRKPNHNQILHLKGFSQAFFIHFACRNFYDLYLRSSLQKIKHNDIDTIRKFMTHTIKNLERFPYRFLFHYLFIRCPNIVDVRINVPKLKHNFLKYQEHTILRNSGLTFCNATRLQTQMNFKQHFNISRFNSKTPMQIVFSLEHKKRKRMENKNKKK